MSPSRGVPISISPEAHNHDAEDECEGRGMERQATESEPEMEDDEGEERTKGAEAGEQCHPVEAEADEIVDQEEEGQDAEVEEEHVPAQGLRDPGQPTPAERAEHCLTHIPYRPWCKHCVRGKAKGRPSRRLKESEAESHHPRIRFDYCIIPDRSEEGELDDEDVGFMEDDP